MILGIISDTHIPDRARHLDRRVLPTFDRLGVQAILHAGDISTQRVLSQLEELAPVYAVRGNRDIALLRELPLTRSLTFENVRLGLMHGHGGWRSYLADRVYFAFHGYQHARLEPRLLKTFPDVQVIVFGHSHARFNAWVEGRLLFNPGSAHFPNPFAEKRTPSVGILHLSAGRVLQNEVIDLV